MSVNHVKRLEGVVNAALKEKAMGEPYGFSINGPAVWPLVNNEGQPVGPGPGWFVLVTIRATGLTDPDIGNGFPIPGILPSDADFKIVAQAMFDKCVKDRDAQDNAIVKALGEGPSMKLSERPK